MTADPPFITAHSLTRTYRVGPAEVHALAGVDLEIVRGEFLAITGVSGSGKSTLLHLLGGLDTPTSGRIVVDGRDLVGYSAYERALYRRTVVGFVFQGFHLVPSLSAEANVALALTFQGVFGARRARLAAEALDRVGLSGRAHHRPGQLSGGEQQRVAIARAVAHRPPLILADEPTGNLDRATAASVLDLLVRLRDESGSALVVVTHDEQAVSRRADRVVHLVDGRIERVYA